MHENFAFLLIFVPRSIVNNSKKMKLPTLLPLLLLLLLPALAGAQSCFTGHRDAGKRLLSEKKYDDAIVRFTAAKNCRVGKPADGDKQMDALIAEAKKAKTPPPPKPATKTTPTKTKTAPGPTEAEKQAEATRRRETDAAARADDDAWDIAQGTLTGCRRYLDKYEHKNGGHTAAARQCVHDYSDDDSDGVLNKDDKCPAVKGTAAHDGCPPPVVSPVTPPSVPMPDMVLVKAGSFTMGCTDEQGSDCDSDEKPAHRVTLTRDFYLARHEITNAQFAAFLNEKGNQTEGGVQWINLEGSWSDAAKCRITASGNTFRAQSGYENYPVVYVSWYGAKAYCEWLSAKTGRRYRLPTEAEWEYAARGGHLAPARQTKYAGSADADDVAWYWENSGDKRLSGDWGVDRLKTNNCQPRRVGGKNANALGLHDMSGNVYEWCSDWKDTYPSGAQTDPDGPSSGSSRVLRGGSWISNTRYVRVSYRVNDYPSVRSINVGFRAAQDK